MTDDLDVRRRRAMYRAAHRGTKEMDALIGRYADAKLPGIGDSALENFERLLAVADPILQAWIWDKEPVSGSEFEDLVQEIRTFHGFDGLERTTEKQ